MNKSVGVSLPYLTFCFKENFLHICFIVSELKNGISVLEILFSLRDMFIDINAIFFNLILNLELNLFGIKNYFGKL